MLVELGNSKIPKNLRVYAVGDVHGCLDELKQIMKMIAEDLNSNPVKKYKVILLGDYMDRGPCSKAVIAFLMALMEINKNVICLRGNHDQALLNFMKDPEEFGPALMRNGGAETLRSFGARVPEQPLEPAQLKSLWRVAKTFISPFHLKFLEKLPHSKIIGDYIFCHAGIRPEIAIKKQTHRDLMWIRDEFFRHKQPFEKVVVHGHTARDSVDIRNNRINLDTRCYASGRLSCAIFEGHEYRIVSNLDQF